VEKPVETSQFQATMRFLFGGTPERLVPVEPMVSCKTDLHKLNPQQDAVVWMGHSTFYLQLAGTRILIDPVFSGWAAPLPFINKAFPGSNVYTAEDIPEIDLLVISHDHWDHLDYIKLTAESKGKPYKLLTPRIGEAVAIGTEAEETGPWWEEMK
jgi:L-ascorbate metabolism protein UlaG (beta-lactamase superfamily)